MPDVRLTTALNVSSDVKSRPADLGAEMTNSQFMDMMMSRLTAMSDSDNELKNLLSKVSQSNGTNQADNEALLNHLKAMKEKTSTASTNAAAPTQKADVKDKIKARIKEISKQDTTPVKDTKALKALQKVAKALLKANDDGTVSLPPALTQKLQEFLDKGDNLTASDIASFMTDFSDVFRSLTLNLANNASDNSDGFQWPQDVKDAFNDLGMSNLVGSDNKPQDMLQILRAVKALVNESQKAAMATLDDKAKAAVASQDQSAVLVPVNNLDQSKTDVKTDDTNTKADANAANAADLKLAAELAAAATPAPQAAPVVAAPAAATVAAIQGFAKADTKQNDKTDDLSLTDIAKQSLLPQPKEEAKTDSKNDAKTSTKAEGRSENRTDVKADAKTDKAASDTLARALTQDVVAKASAQAAVSSLAADVKAAFETSPVVNPSGGDSIGIAPTGSAATSALATSDIIKDSAKPSPVTQQVIAQIQQRGGKATEISVQLTPAELGSVEVRMSIQKDGTAHAVVMAEKPETLALLQKDATHLQRALQDAGINAKTENMSFSLSDQRQAQQFGQNGRKRFSRSAISDQSVKEVSMNVLADTSIISDTRINYHA